MYSMTHYTVKSTAEAWNLVNELFPTDYIQNDEYTANAGYPVYESTSASYPDAYIRDLCVRFEINVNDTWITIWIEEDEETESTKEEATAEDIQAATRNQYTFEPENAVLVRFHVMGYTFSSDAEKRVYEALVRRDEGERICMSFDLCDAYCMNHGIKWNCMRVLSVQHFTGKNEGHFVVEGLVTIRE